MNWVQTHSSIHTGERNTLQCSEPLPPPLLRLLFLLLLRLLLLLSSAQLRAQMQCALDDAHPLRTPGACRCSTRSSLPLALALVAVLLDRPVDTAAGSLVGVRPSRAVLDLLGRARRAHRHEQRTGQEADRFSADGQRAGGLALGGVDPLRRVLAPTVDAVKVIEDCLLDALRRRGLFDNRLEGRGLGGEALRTRHPAEEDFLVAVQLEVNGANEHGLDSRPEHVHEHHRQQRRLLDR